LNLLRRDYARIWLVDRCTIYREPEPEASDYGQAANVEYPGGWTAVASSQACRIIATVRRANESANTGQVQSSKDAVLLLKFDVADVKAGDRIRITTRSPIKTFDLEVVGSLCRTDRIKAKIDVLKIGDAVELVSGDALLDSNGESILDSNGEEILDSVA
jgi:hypothetical protein